MTRDQVNRVLREMEHVREASYECETPAQERRMSREYGRLSKIVKPYLDGSRPYSEEPVHV